MHIVKRYTILFLFLLFNFLDFVFTWVGVKLNIIQEGNPILDKMLTQTPILFLILKLIIAPLAILIIFIGAQQRKWIKKVLNFTLCLYGVVIFFASFLLLPIL